MGRLISSLGLVLFLVGSASPSIADPNVRNWLGKQRALVLSVEWSGTPAVVSQRTLEETFFNRGQSSLRDFFLENSVGTFDLTGTVLPWRTSSKTWHPNQGCDIDPIVAEAWKLFSKDVKISDHDSDHNGKIDHLFIVHSGRIGSDRVGPDCVFTDSKMADETAVFQSQGVGSMGGSIPIGFYIHEAGHKLYGFPDLYADHYHGQYGIGMWGMMGLGCWGTNNFVSAVDLFRYPGHFEPKSKIQIGWVKSRLVTKSQTGLSLKPVEQTGDIIEIPMGNGDSYYLEYRSDQGFSHGQRGHGMLIWKDYDVMQADGRDDLNHGHNLGYRPLPPNDENFGDDSDVFPGALGITSYVDAEFGISIQNIVQTDSEIRFDVQLKPHFTPSDASRRKQARVFDGVERL